jgi:hypothetical protein
MQMTFSSDNQSADDSGHDPAVGDRATVPAAQLEALRGRVAEWDAQFDDLDLSALEGRSTPDDLQTDRSIATSIVNVFPRLALAGGARLMTQRRMIDGRCHARTLPLVSRAASAGDRVVGGVAWSRLQEDVHAPDRTLVPTLVETMAVVSGDGSLESYIEAAVLYRELAALGSRGGASPWRSCRIVDTNPFIAAGRLRARRDGQGTRSDLWIPGAIRDAAETIYVQLWTATTEGPLRVLGHGFRFRTGSRQIEVADIHVRHLLRNVDRVECWVE